MAHHYDRALFLYDRRRYDLAEQELRRQLAEAPGHAAAHALMGLCRNRLKARAEASEWVDRAIGLAPELPFAHYAKGVVLASRGRLPDAERAVREAIRLDPTRAEFRFYLACLHSDRDRPRLALAEADRALQLDPAHAGSAGLRALALTRLRRHAEAQSTIDAALALAPEDDFVHTAEGWKRWHRGDRAGALSHFREALRLNPENRWAQSGLKAPRARARWLAVLAVVVLGQLARLAGSHGPAGARPGPAPLPDPPGTVALLAALTVLATVAIVVATAWYARKRADPG